MSPWFEPLLVRVLRHEYAASLRFGPAEGDVHKLAPPAAPVQLYVHIPFCESLCPFCSFHRVQFREQKARDYFEALRMEIRSYHERGFQFGDVYVGGGTPTIQPAELLRTLELIRALWPIRTISVETNPNHLDEEMLAALASAGVGRLSVGVQSFDDSLLRQMQRYQPYGSGQAIRERLARALGRIRTLNVDMMFNFPSQTPAGLEQDLATLLALEVDQVSFYPVMTAPSARRKMQQTLGTAAPGHTYELYRRIQAAMQADYEPSSAWCFSRRARAAGGAPMIDEYITATEDYVGVGSGSFSYLNGWMHSTTFSLNQYRARLAAGRGAITRSRRLSLRERMRYDFLVRLFGMSLPHAYVRRKYGAAFWWLMAPELVGMRLLGATRHGRDEIRLTPLGMYCWVLMMAEFFNSVNAFRDEMRLNIRDELEIGALPEVRIPLTSVGRRRGAQ